MSEDDGRHLPVHRPDAKPEPAQPLKLIGRSLINSST